LRLGVERGENVKDVGRVIGAGESSPAEEVGKTLNIKTLLTRFAFYGQLLDQGASMEPRLLGRGESHQHSGGVRQHMASMEPRLLGRGEERSG